MYFAILSRLDVNHQCVGRADGQTDKRTEWRLAIPPS